MSSTTDIYTAYKILNLVNSKVYIGITTRSPDCRWKEHLYYHSTKKSRLYSAMKKYGIGNFQFSILEQTDTIETLKELEVKYIQEYNSYCFQENSNGYNMTLGGDGSFGFKPSTETLKKLSEASKNMSEETKRKISETLKGRTLSEEHKRKMSQSLKGRVFSKDTKRKLSEAAKRRYLNPEERKKLSEIGKKRTFSEEHKIKISESKKGKSRGTFSEDHKRKISEANKGKTLSEEHKRKISEARIRLLNSNKRRTH